MLSLPYHFSVKEVIQELEKLGFLALDLAVGNIYLVASTSKSTNLSSQGRGLSALDISIDRLGGAVDLTNIAVTFLHDGVAFSSAGSVIAGLITAGSVSASSTLAAQDVVYVRGGEVEYIKRSDLNPGEVASKFHLFPNLAREIKDNIWKFAILGDCGPRTIGFTEVCYERDAVRKVSCLRFPSGGIFAANGDHLNFVATGQLVPNFLATATKDVHKLALIHGFAEFNITGSRKNIMYRAEVDTIRLDSRSHPTNLILCEVIPLKIVQMIKHLELNGDLFIAKNNFQWYMFNIVPMTTLKTLSIKGKIDLFPDSHAPDSLSMNFDFFECATPRGTIKHFLPVMSDDSGVKCLGVIAINILRGLITDHGEVERYSHIWEFLDILAANCERVPRTVNVFTEYEIIDGIDWSDEFGF